MIGGNAVGFEQHHVDHIFVHLDFAANDVLILDSAPNFTGRAQTHHIGQTLLNILRNLLISQVPAFGVRGMVAGQGFFAFLPAADFRQVFLGTEAGVGQALLHQAFAKTLINFRPTALLIGAVVSLLLGLVHHALVKFQAEAFQPLHNAGDAVLHLPLFVGVFNAQDNPAAGLMGHALVDQSGV